MLQKKVSCNWYQPINIQRETCSDSCIQEDKVAMQIGHGNQGAITLVQLIENLDQLDPAMTIYIQPGQGWTGASFAIACFPSQDGSAPAKAMGMQYFLEVSTAKEVVDVWKVWRGGQVPSLKERCAAIIYYAENDAYMPVSTM